MRPFMNQVRSGLLIGELVLPGRGADNPVPKPRFVCPVRFTPPYGRAAR